MIPLHTFSNFLLLFERNSGIGCIDSIRSLSVALNYIFITAKIDPFKVTKLQKGIFSLLDIWLNPKNNKNQIYA